MKENNNQTKWISANASNATPITKASDRLAKKIDEQIDWYSNNATRKEDDYIKAHLKLAKNLAENVESSEDLIFIEKIIGTFCDIIETQRSVISDLETEVENVAADNYTPAYIAPDEGYSDDAQLQNAFIAYVLCQGKSSYTANDYCSRIKKIWKSFIADYKDGKTPEELVVDEELSMQDTPLLNAYHHADELNCYISSQIAQDEENRNWANARAAFNKFDEFKTNTNNER